MPFDIFDNHDGIVKEHSDGQNHPRFMIAAPPVNLPCGLDTATGAPAKRRWCSRASR